MDEFSERYAHLLRGSYDCVDRVVLNAYFSLGHNPGGFRVWWRRLHDDNDEHLDDTHLMRMAGRFSRRVRAYGKEIGISVIDCDQEERKHRIAEDYLREHDVGPGVFLILVARAPATVWKVKRSARGVIRNLEKGSRSARRWSSRPRHQRPPNPPPRVMSTASSSSVGPRATRSAGTTRWPQGGMRPRSTSTTRPSKRLASPSMSFRWCSQGRREGGSHAMVGGRRRRPSCSLRTPRPWSCRRLAELLLGGPPSSPLPLTIGILEIVSSQPLHVSA
ncbi:MAG: hypothetical protein ACRDHM_09215, partial [Actinomycetota bacterium]